MYASLSYRGAGFVGANLIKKRLVDEGHDVVSIDNYSTAEKKKTNKRGVYYDLDISNNPIESVVGKQDLVFLQLELEYYPQYRIQPTL